jgi:CBS domain-containing protein
VLTVEPEAPVYQAIELMLKHSVGALLVVSSDRPCGIVTERDYLRRVALEGRQSKTTAVREIMSARLVTVDPDTTVDTCMSLMTERKIRHLPVMVAETLVGLVSIGDVVKHRLEEQRGEIRDLIDYVQTGAAALYATG